MTRLRPANAYTWFLPQFNSSERIRRHSSFQAVSRFAFSIHLCLLVPLDLEQVVLDFLVELLLLLQFRMDGNEFFLGGL